MAMKSFSSRNVFINIDINSVSQPNGASNSCMRSSEVQPQRNFGNQMFQIFFVLLYIEQVKGQFTSALKQRRDRRIL